MWSASDKMISIITFSSNASCKVLKKEEKDSMSETKNNEQNNSRNSLQKKLKSRHLSMIAIGGSIGTGLFVASGGAIHTAGPVGALVAYSMIAIMVYFIMTSLGEMAAYMPSPGSFCTYAKKFVGSSFGKAMSYNYYFNWSITIAAELSAATIIMSYWFPHTPILVWTSIFFGMIVILNLLSVQIYGECEYWLSILKVIAILAFIVIGALLIFGVIGHAHNVGFSNWSTGHHGFYGGWSGLFVTFVLAAFSFQGTELVGVAAGESDSPSSSIPRAIRTIFWRILLFYLLTMLIISTLIHYTDPRLIHANTQHISMSPFTIILSSSGLHHAASLMNFIILIAVLSAANSDLYSATRILFSMSKKGEVAPIFSKCTVRGIPIYALLFTAMIGATVFLTSIFGRGQVFFWLINLSTLAGIIAWIGIAISHYGFRMHLKRKNQSPHSLPFYAKLFPFGPIFSIVICVVIILGQIVVLNFQHHLNWTNLLSTYLLIPIIILIGIVDSKSKAKKLLNFEQNSA